MPMAPTDTARAGATPAGTPPARSGVLMASLAAAVALAILIGLGVWQLERRTWKEALIATLQQRLAATAVALPPSGQWSTLEAGRDEFLRVTFAAEFQNDEEALVYTTGSSMRSDTSGPGYWVFTPARLGDGHMVMVNRGFVPEGRQNEATRRDGAVSGRIDITGVLRWPESPACSRPPAIPYATSGSAAIPRQWPRRRTSPIPRHSMWRWKVRCLPAASRTRVRCSRACPTTTSNTP